MTPELFSILALIHAVVAIFTTAANLGFQQWRATTTQRRDRVTLRAAFVAELEMLRDLYKSNLDALYAGKDGLASSRMFSVVYRGNLGRLHTLAEKELAPIVAAYAASERVEAFLAVTCKAHGATAFSMGKERLFADEMTALYEKAAAAAQRALRELGHEAETAALEKPAAESARRLAAA